MGKISKEEMALINKESEEVFKLLLKKTGTSYKRLIEIAKQEFVVDNVDMLTPAEKRQFKHIAL
jgi:hypothetical protein